MKILESYSAIAKSLLIEADDDRFVSIGYGRYKLKGKEEDDDADVYTKTDSGKFVKSADQKSDDDDKGGEEKPSGGGMGAGDFERDFDTEKPDDEPSDMDTERPDDEPEDEPFGGDSGTDADFQGEPPEGAREPDDDDDTEISDANSGPIDRDDILDMLKKDSGIMDKIGTGDDDDLYWDGMDLVSSKFDDDTIASIPDDANMTLGDLKKQIMDYDDEDGEWSIDQQIASVEKEMNFARDKGNETGSSYYEKEFHRLSNVLQHLKKEKDAQDGKDESITINGKKYKPIKESKKPNPHILKENYDRIFRSLK